jgi:Metal-dependent hydrolases of the beta-lactamase superfamily I
MRSSALLRGTDGTAILIDAGPEFRIQALRAGITRLDAVLVTHSHADHLHGMDDLRIFSSKRDMPVYANDSCIEDIRNRFDYVFKPTQEGGGKPHLELREAVPGRELTVAGVRIVPVQVTHGALPVLGWRFGDTAYLTDCSGIPDESWPLLEGVRHLVLGALRVRPHSTHLNFPQAVEVIARIGPERTWLTHLCHDFTHEEIMEWLAKNAPDKKIEPAHDGLRIAVGQLD